MMSKMRHVQFAVGAGVFAVAAFLAWVLSPAQPNGRADPDDASQVARGKALYKAHCASCHGANLEGQADWRIRKPDGKLPAPPHDETGHTWHHSDEQLFRLTKFGLKPPLAPDGYQSDMPAYAETLKDSEIWAVLAFIKSRWPPEIRGRQKAMSGRER